MEDKEAEDGGKRDKRRRIKTDDGRKRTDVGRNNRQQKETDGGENKDWREERNIEKRNGRQKKKKSRKVRKMRETGNETKWEKNFK